MAKAVGIDLGTTNSVVASVLEGGRAEVIPNGEGQRTTPSVVAFTDDGQRLVGQVARRQAILNPEATIYSVKRFIGRRWEEVEEEAGIVSYRVVRGPNDAVRIEVRGRQYAPEEISALILRKLADDAGRFLGERVNEAVITVPAYFNDAQRQATKDAGRIAGLDVLRIINEPTAAALAYGLDKSGSETVLVYDFGGGTFDVSLLEVGDGVIEVRATNGDGHLGGDDFDKRNVDHLAEEFRSETGIDLRQDPQALQRLYEAAERAKVELSSATQTQINLPFITADASGPKHLDTRLSRAKLGELTADLLDRTVVPVRQALDDAKEKGAKSIDHVVMVGGMTRMPAVREGQGADRQGPQHDGQPRRGRRDRSRRSGRRAQGRGRGRHPARRAAAVDRPRDARRRHDETDRAQHDDPGPSQRGLLHGRGQPTGRRHQRAAGRA